MTRRLLAAAFVLVLAMPAWAENKVDAKKLKGKWLREVDGTKLVYKFKDEKKWLIRDERTWDLVKRRSMPFLEG